MPCEVWWPLTQLFVMLACWRSCVGAAAHAVTKPRLRLLHPMGSQLQKMRNASTKRVEAEELIELANEVKNPLADVDESLCRYSGFPHVTIVCALCAITKALSLVSVFWFASAQNGTDTSIRYASSDDADGSLMAWMFELVKANMEVQSPQ